MGLEHLLLSERAADSIVLAYDEEQGPFRLSYHLAWDDSWQLRDADLILTTERATRQLRLQTDGQGHWRHGDGRSLHPQPQAYTRLSGRRYLFENLDGSGFQAELPVDEGDIVVDYPGLFQRVATSAP